MALRRSCPESMAVDSRVMPAATAEFSDSQSAGDGREASETPFDDTVIGLLTRHGIAPARGALGSKAKINQDRGVVCWPFNGSHNQALLCVFDGHGLSGERIAEYCAHEIPMRLEADRAALSIDPVKCLINNVRCGSFMPHCEDLSVS